MGLSVFNSLGNGVTHNESGESNDGGTGNRPIDDCVHQGVFNDASFGKQRSASVSEHFGYVTRRRGKRGERSGTVTTVRQPLVHGSSRMRRIRGTAGCGLRVFRASALINQKASLPADDYWGGQRMCCSPHSRRPRGGCSVSAHHVVSLLRCNQRRIELNL